jgi:hypothetical protein
MGLTCSRRGEIDSIGDWVALTQDSGDFAHLPVDDRRQDQVQQLQAFICSHSSRALIPATPPVKDTCRAVFLGQAGGALELVAGKHYRCDTANAEVSKDGSLAYKITRISLVP